MDIRKEIKALAERVFNDNLFKTVLDAVLQEMEDDGYEISEREYREGKEGLANLLNASQKKVLDEAEALYEANLKYAMQFAFKRGIYIGFSQYFSKEPTEQPFYDYVQKDILFMPRMKHHFDYYERRMKANASLNTLIEQVNNADQDFSMYIISAWEERLLGVLRFAYYLGYRCALCVIDDVKPINALIKMTNMILMTENEIEFTYTCLEREIRAYGRSHKRQASDNVEL